MISTLIVVAAFVGAWLITSRVRNYALAHALLDIPNDRSSHALPTPRGGGIAIVVASIVSFVVLGSMGLLPWRTVAALVGGGVLIAAVGWVDDRRGLPALTRLLTHGVAATWSVAWVGGLSSLQVGSVTVPLALAGPPLAVLGVIWVTNLYNFMDGIDGLAGMQAVTAGVVGGGLLVAGGATGLGVSALVIAASSAGFLVLNWPPARIFMGDVGSGFLGYSFATVALASEGTRALPLLAWVLLIAMFVFDATITLARRARAGEKVMAAHRSHAYQRAVRSGWSHRQVSLGVLGLNTVLSLLAIVAWSRPRLMPVMLVVAIVMLSAVYVGIGRRYPMVTELKNRSPQP